MAFHHTHGMDTVITRCSNNYGPYQFPEKLIPLMILNAFDGQPLPVYGDGLQVRDWIHVDDHCAAIDASCRAGGAGEVYNIGAGNERPNLDVVRAILRLAGPRRIADSPRGRSARARPSLRDERDARSATRLGWRPRHVFDDGLAETVAWYRGNGAWTEGVRSGAYRAYYDRQYAARLAAT